MDKRTDVKVPCKKGCGREYSPAGITQHEKYCTGKDYVPGYSYKRRRERNIQNPKPQPQEEARYTGEEDMVLELFYDDAALFTAVIYLLEARDGTDALRSLKAAKAMIDAKIRFLER